MVVGWHDGSRPSQSIETPNASRGSTGVQLQEHSHNFTFMNYQHLPYVSSSHAPFFFSHLYHQFGAPIQSTLSLQPPPVNPRLPAMPQFPLPFTLSPVHAQLHHLGEVAVGSSGGIQRRANRQLPPPPTDTAMDARLPSLNSEPDYQ
jgi:hypothetical protein